MAREAADALRRRAAELAETGKGISYYSAPATEYQTGTGMVPPGTAQEVTRKEIRAQCKECYQEYTLPPGTKTFTCEICGKTQAV